MAKPRVLYCHCTYAKIIPEPVKKAVLRKLADSDVAFEAVADLCEMSARKDPALARLAAGDGELRIAACYPRAVKWLFSAAGSPLPEQGVRVENMRTTDADEVFRGLLDGVTSEGASADAGDRDGDGDGEGDGTGDGTEDGDGEGDGDRR